MKVGTTGNHWRRTATLACAAALALAGCNNTGETITVTQLPPGEKCPAGGLQLTVGNQAPQVVCNGTGTNGTNGSNGSNGSSGADGVSTLVTQTTLPTGDARCPAGGVLVQSGLDDGADGGVPRDATLSPGEVRSSSVVCAGDTGVRVGSFSAPAGALGTDTILVNGSSSTGTGGRGGSVSIGNGSLSNGGHLKAFKTGHVDASFTAPVAPSWDPGDAPAVVSADTVVTTKDTDTPGLDAGVLFVFGDALYTSVGPQLPGARVTGLSVAAGVSLTLPPTQTGALTIDRSCRNAGTINASDVELACLDFVGAPGSRLVARATLNQAPSPGLTILTQANFVNAGTVDVGGLVTVRGGLASTFHVSAGGLLVNTGTINGQGATQATSGGGAGATVNLDGKEGLWNSGAIDVSGGASGTPSDGWVTAGAGGFVGLSSVGALRNSGALTLVGGEASCADCAGGAGGTADLRGQSVLWSATVLARGGAGARPGHGGAMYVQTTGSWGGNWWSGAGSIWLSGTIDLSGGSGGSTSAGDGGTFSAWLYDGLAGSEVVLFGYTRISANGGDGNGGGAGGVVRVTHDLGESSLYGDMGGVVNQLALSARGGASGMTSQAAGGAGGRVELLTQPNRNAPLASWELLDNSGAIDVTGGAGIIAGAGGSVTLRGRAGVNCTGTVTAAAGAGTDSSATGGVVHFESLGVVTTSGSIDASSAGTSTGPGSAGGDITLTGNTVQVGATLSANGSNSSAGAGGGGGWVTLNSMSRNTQVTAPAVTGISVKAGTGTPSGARGGVTIDGFDATASWTH
jgi:hypothetical protein